MVGLTGSYFKTVPTMNYSANKKIPFGQIKKDKDKKDNSLAVKKKVNLLQQIGLTKIQVKMEFLT